ncbi:hypothetical protein ELY21_01390 [Legionella sp. km535]|uniref:hypothetical protein n=1 Tax=Legionella sp. km535 TaxID=2498107 RepID=UPI000F8DCBAE|nr:hypothetical protein [Legionella sp. km535]RUR20200.1 hypothetical protein ELY21_01390 [Legionella sp. km535]
MIFQMLRAAIEGVSENNIGRARTINKILSMIIAEERLGNCSLEDKELIFDGVKFLVLLNENESDEFTRTNALQMLSKLSLEFQNYSLINSIILKLKFSHNHSLIVKEDSVDGHIMNHLKIWFPKKGTHPLGGIVNELRLIRQSRLYLKRNEHITLLTNFNTKDDENYVHSFCKKHGICFVTPSDIQIELKNQGWEDKAVQLKLFDIAMAELTHPAGHPVIASDIFRLLSPVLKLGAYSDIDRLVKHIDTSISPNELPALVLNFQFEITGLSMLTVKSLNTDFMWAKNTEHPLLVKHRRNIYSNYCSPSFIYNINMNYKVTQFGEPLDFDQAAIDQYKQFCLEYSFTNSPESILKFREELRERFPQQIEAYFYYYVMSLTGPMSLAGTLFYNPSISQASLDEISKYRVSEIPIQLVNEDSNKSSDLSWLNVGVTKLMNEEKRIIESARIIQRFWRNAETRLPAAEVDSEQFRFCNII